MWSNLPKKKKLQLWQQQFKERKSTRNKCTQPQEKMYPAIRNKCTRPQEKMYPATGNKCTRPQEKMYPATGKNVNTLQLLQQASKKIIKYIRNLRTQCCQCFFFFSLLFIVVFPSFPQLINHWEDYLFKNKQKHTQKQHLLFSYFKHTFIQAKESSTNQFKF